MTDKYFIRTVQNAMQILQLFTHQKREWTLTEIANEKGMSPASTLRLLRKLEDYHYLERDKKTKKYKLGLSILQLSGVVTATMELHREAQGVALELANKLGEAVHIGILEETATVYLNKIESLHPVSLASYIGKQIPSYCSGCGKVILAHKNEKEREKIISQLQEEGFHPLASNTVQSSTRLREDLDKIRELGYAVCVNEVSEGITSIAAPIFDHSREVIAGISITGPNNRISVEKCILHVVKAGKQISEKLGCY